jgi:hypothetical protein
MSGLVLSLPTGTAVGPDEIERVCHLIRFMIQHAHELSDALSKLPSKQPERPAAPSVSVNVPSLPPMVPSR